GAPYPIPSASLVALCGYTNLQPADQAARARRRPMSDQANINATAVREIARLKAQISEREALGVPPREAERLLSISHKKCYDLLQAGELESYTVGRARRITLASIKNFIARQLAQYPPA